MANSELQDVEQLPQRLAADHAHRIDNNKEPGGGGEARTCLVTRRPWSMCQGAECGDIGAWYVQARRNGFLCGMGWVISMHWYPSLPITAQLSRSTTSVLPVPPGAGEHGSGALLNHGLVIL